eukprot:PLAT6996.1.p1 GENE.PLAT6996.1~~PLAT6996.1.p1  ORF type:complete len:377 (+),score=159.81 PLAT6996.1:137-1267(+)
MPACEICLDDFNYKDGLLTGCSRVCFHCLEAHVKIVTRERRLLGKQLKLPCIKADCASRTICSDKLERGLYVAKGNKQAAVALKLLSDARCLERRRENEAFLRCPQEGCIGGAFVKPSQRMGYSILPAFNWYTLWAVAAVALYYPVHALQALLLGVAIECTLRAAFTRRLTLQCCDCQRSWSQPATAFKSPLTHLMTTLLTKDCPFCGITIRKNGGCPHMVCGNCRKAFCWRCRKAPDPGSYLHSTFCRPWNLHYYYLPVFTLSVIVWRLRIVHALLRWSWAAARWTAGKLALLIAGVFKLLFRAIRALLSAVVRLLHSAVVGVYSNDTLLTLAFLVIGIAMLAIAYNYYDRVSKRTVHYKSRGRPHTRKKRIKQH